MNEDRSIQVCKLHLIHCTTIDKQILQLIWISLVGTHISASGSLMWEEAGVPVENTGVQEGDNHTLSHATSVDHRDRTRVAAVALCIKLNNHMLMLDIKEIFQFNSYLLIIFFKSYKAKLFYVMYLWIYNIKILKMFVLTGGRLFVFKKAVLIKNTKLSVIVWPNHLYLVKIYIIFYIIKKKN